MEMLSKANKKLFFMGSSLKNGIEIRDSHTEPSHAKTWRVEEQKPPPFRRLSPFIAALRMIKTATGVEWFLSNRC